MTVPLRAVLSRVGGGVTSRPGQRPEAQPEEEADSTIATGRVTNTLYVIRNADG